MIAPDDWQQTSARRASRLRTRRRCETSHLARSDGSALPIRLRLPCAILNTQPHTHQATPNRTVPLILTFEAGLPMGISTSFWGRDLPNASGFVPTGGLCEATTVFVEWWRGSRLRLRRYKTALQRIADQVGLRARPQFAHHFGAVLFDRTRAEDQPGGDFGVGMALDE